MRIEILDRAQSDLLDGFHFYEAREAGLGSYFLTNLYADIESLRIHAGVPGRRETGNAETLKAEHLAVLTRDYAESFRRPEYLTIGSIRG